jgi:hypothetical protein
VLTTCQPSTVWCSRERLPAAAAQPAKARQSCSATDYYYYVVLIIRLQGKVYFVYLDLSFELSDSALKMFTVRGVSYILS